MDSTDLCYLSAVELRQLYKLRKVSPVEVIQAVLKRMECFDGGINAFVTATPELALAQAREAELLYGTGEVVPPLAGVPLSIKDLVPTKGIRTARGSLLYTDWVPDYNAPVAARLLDAGGVLLGKTTTPEFGWKGDSANRVNGVAHNPWQQGRTPGGSSGGAAAAVAAGMGALGQASDGAGSVRIPAGFCGVYGYKPAWGLVPQYPASAVELISHLGSITRTVADAALMLEVMAGEDPHDPAARNGRQGYVASLDGDIRGLRVAWSADLGYAAVDPEVRQITAAAAQRFSELGCHVEEAHPCLEDPWEKIVKIIWSAGFAGLFQDGWEKKRPLLDSGLVEVIELGLEYSAADLAAAFGRRHTYFQDWRIFMESYDLLLTPSLPVTAFNAGADHPGMIDGQLTSFLGWTAFTYPFNVTGQPAATVPCGWSTQGLPVGLQIVGRWRDDLGVLNASAAFEALAPWQQQRPDLSVFSDH